MPTIDIASLSTQIGTRYLPPHDAPCKDRQWKALGAAGGLTQFGGQPRDAVTRGVEQPAALAQP
jgi:uncharacterized cupin superfamily protein